MGLWFVNTTGVWKKHVRPICIFLPNKTGVISKIGDRFHRRCSNRWNWAPVGKYGTGHRFVYFFQISPSPDRIFQKHFSSRCPVPSIRAASMEPGTGRHLIGGTGHRLENAFHFFPNGGYLKKHTNRCPVPYFPSGAQFHRLEHRRWNRSPIFEITPVLFGRKMQIGRTCFFPYSGRIYEP